MIDIHCHILPAIDDGPADLATAVAMARLAAADGITTIVATPHLNSRLYDQREIGDRLALLSEALRREGLALELLAGADVSAMLPPDALRSFTINRSRYLLVEFPHAYLPGNAREILYEFVLQGFWPIITHPERNGGIVANPGLLLDLLADGIFVQLTAGSLTGDFGPAPEACAQYLLRRGAVHFLATDAHSPGRRPPLLSAGLAVASEIIGREEALRLVHHNPAAVLADLPLHA
ncbi:MAG: CpsB/CapC family capsule biosynthesis tyrosine phosphatase [Thermodesulfobacteriota bacterium]